VCSALAFTLWDDDDDETLPSIEKLDAEGLLVKSELSPTSELSTVGFQRYTSCIVAATCIGTGLGMEVILGGYMVSHFTNQDGELLWHAAQFSFSLMLTIAILGESAYSLPFVVLGLWKFGFPETIGYFLKARRTSSRKPFSIVSNFCNGMGLLLHHSAGAFFVSALAMGLMNLVRITLAGTVVLVVQHWFVPLKYLSHAVYNLVQLLLEGYFEFELISALPKMEPKNGVDTTLRACSLVMLVAHWLYLTAAFIDIFIINFCGLEEHVDETGESFTSLQEDLREDLAPTAAESPSQSESKFRPLGPRMLGSVQ